MATSTVDELTESMVNTQDPQVVLCGSFRKDRSGLVRAYDDLVRTGCVVLSPADIAFVAETDGFAYAEGDLGSEPGAIEEQHLSCIQRSDFVWLHMVDGLVGASVSLEIGYAHALGIPVFAAAAPSDVTLEAFTRVV